MVAIETKALTKKFKEKVAVDNLNLKIEEGQLFSLLGVNGAGKTTTIRMLLGLSKESSGSIKIYQKDFKKNKSELKQIMNVSPQETAIAPNLSVRENLEFISGVYNIKDKKVKVNELLKLFKLEKIEKQRVKRLSGGWQRRLSIAMALVNEPKILFLDEPTVGLDVIARKELWEIIKDLKKKVTIILTTHYMEEALALSDIVGIISEGKLNAIGTPQELIKKANVKTFEEAFIKLATGGVQS